MFPAPPPAVLVRGGDALVADYQHVFGVALGGARVWGHRVHGCEKGGPEPPKYHAAADVESNGSESLLTSGHQEP